MIEFINTRIRSQYLTITTLRLAISLAPQGTQHCYPTIARDTSSLSPCCWRTDTFCHSFCNKQPTLPLVAICSSTTTLFMPTPGCSQVDGERTIGEALWRRMTICGWWDARNEGRITLLHGCVTYSVDFFFCLTVHWKASSYRLQNVYRRSGVVDSSIPLGRTLLRSEALPRDFPLIYSHSDQYGDNSTKSYGTAAWRWQEGGRIWRWVYVMSLPGVR